LNKFGRENTARLTSHFRTARGGGTLKDHGWRADKVKPRRKSDLTVGKKRNEKRRGFRRINETELGGWLALPDLGKIKKQLGHGHSGIKGTYQAGGGPVRKFSANGEPRRGGAARGLGGEFSDRIKELIQQPDLR